MIFFVVGFAMLLHVLFWGAGLAALATPREWRRFWPVFAPVCGFALQGVVVWVGSYLNLPGTNRYAWPSEIVPLALAALAIRREGLRHVVDAGARFALVWACVAGALAIALLPLAIASRGLTSVSLGSCDAADYAAGARVFMEFAHADRGGFLGLTEVVRVMSADNFFDFWLRLNHFTPSAVIALNGSILHCPPHELTSIATAVILATSLPLVFWLSRAIFGYSPIACLVIAGLYGISPVAWYSFAQVSPAPLLAGQAIAVVNWTAFALWNSRLNRRRARSYAGLLTVGFSVLLGAYNFILLVALAPAGVYVVIEILRTRSIQKVLPWLAAVLGPLAIASVVFWARVAGLVDRFRLFRTYDFGWRIPGLGPEGWIGFVRGGDLAPWPFLLRWPLAVGCVAALSWSVVATLRRRRRLYVLVSVVAPVLIGYGLLELRGALANTNASYDAFKLFAVFYPMLLPAFCWWITLRWSTQLLRWVAVAALSALVVFGNAVACAMFVYELSGPPLLVDGELRHLRRLETDPAIHSLNVLVPDMWSRLWANAFLLRQPQYFATHTYEGRLNTPLRGEWDLVGGPLALRSTASSSVTEHYRVVDTRADDFVRLVTGSGWYPEEHDKANVRWSWATSDAVVEMENPHDRPIRFRVRLDGRAISPRELALSRVGDETAPFARVGESRALYSLGVIAVPPGRSRWALRSSRPPGSAPGDTRALNVCVYTLWFDPASATDAEN